MDAGVACGARKKRDWGSPQRPRIEPRHGKMALCVFVGLSASYRAPSAIEPTAQQMCIRDRRVAVCFPRGDFAPCFGVTAKGSDCLAPFKSVDEGGGSFSKTITSPSIHRMRKVTQRRRCRESPVQPRSQEILVAAFQKTPFPETQPARDNTRARPSIA